MRKLVFYHCHHQHHFTPTCLLSVPPYFYLSPLLSSHFLSSCTFGNFLSLSLLAWGWKSKQRLILSCLCLFLNFHPRCCPHTAASFKVLTLEGEMEAVFVTRTFLCVCVWKAGMVSIHGARPHLTYSMFYWCISFFYSFFFFFFFVEKPSTALWTRALLLKRRCQHTTTRCWARTTRKTTSLSAKQVRSAAAVFAEVLLLFWHPSSSTSQNQPPIACLEGSPNLPFFPALAIEMAYWVSKSGTWASSQPPED